MSLSPESNLKLAQLRSRYLAGEELSIEELQLSVRLMREARGQAYVAARANASAKGKTKTPINSDDLLNELDNL